MRIPVVAQFWSQPPRTPRELRRLVNRSVPAAQPTCLVVRRCHPRFLTEKALGHICEGTDERQCPSRGGHQSTRRRAQRSKERRVVPFERRAGVWARLIANVGRCPRRFFAKIPFDSQ